MNRWPIALLCVALSVSTSHADESNVTTPEDCEAKTNTVGPTTFTIDGFTYQNVRWGRVTPSTATIFHKTGVTTLRLEKLPTEWQSLLGYDPVKAERYRQAEAKARAAWLQAKQQRDQLVQQQQNEKERLQRLEAGAVDFHCTIMALHQNGMVVRTAKTYLPYSTTTTPASEPLEGRPKQIEISFAFLTGHPGLGILAVGDTISCSAYRDGVQETDGEPLPRWVYVGEAHHRILPPPPP